MANKNKNASPSKNITLSSLKQKNKVYNETFTVNIDGYDVSINKTWSPTKISELIEEYVNNLRTLGTENHLSVTYLYLLLLRYFTSLSIPNELGKQLEWLNELIDSGYLNKLISSLPNDQIDEVSVELKNITDNMRKNIPIINEELSKLEIENDEVKQLISKNTSEVSE